MDILETAFSSKFIANYFFFFNYSNVRIRKIKREKEKKKTNSNIFIKLINKNDSSISI